MSKLETKEKLKGHEIMNVYNILFTTKVDDPKIAYSFYKVLSSLKDEVEAIKAAKEALLLKYNGRELANGNILLPEDYDKQADYVKEEKELFNKEYEVKLEIDKEIFDAEKLSKYFENAGILLKLSVIL